MGKLKITSCSQSIRPQWSQQQNQLQKPCKLMKTKWQLGQGKTFKIPGTEWKSKLTIPESMIHNDDRTKNAFIKKPRDPKLVTWHARKTIRLKLMTEIKNQCKESNED